jgi:phage shock protein A
LARKKEHGSQVEQFQIQWQKQKAAVDQLKMALAALNGKIEEAKRKKSLLIAKKKRAQAQQHIQETMTGLRNASAFDAFDRMAGKIEQMEAEAEAGAELAEQFSGDVLSHQFEKLESTVGADDDLVALKRKMGVLPPEAPPAPPEVRTPARVEADEAIALDEQEQAELARALAELDAEEQLRAKP